MSEVTLEQLAARTASGRPSHARQFLEAIAPTMLRTVRQVMGAAHADVEDVVQEALVATLDALPTFRGECSLLHFARRIAMLSALNARRKVHLRQKIAPTTSGEDLDALVAPGPTPADALDASRRRELFASMLDELPRAQAEAIGLHCILGLTIAEAAASAGVPTNTLRGQLVTAKAALRKRLESDSLARDLFRGVL